MTGPVIWLTWIYDCLIAGNEDGVKAAKEQMKQCFDCDDLGALTEYVGCRVDRNKNSIKIAKPVLLQSFEDEFGCTDNNVKILAESGSVLVQNEQDSLSEGEQFKYSSGVGKLLHMMQWSRQESYNAVCELSSGTSPAHIKAMKQVMEYWLSTKEIGLVL